MEVKIKELTEGQLVLLSGCGNDRYHIVTGHSEQNVWGATIEHLSMKTGKGKHFFKRFHVNKTFEVSEDENAQLCVHHHQESEDD